MNILNELLDVMSNKEKCIDNNIEDIVKNITLFNLVEAKNKPNIMNNILFLNSELVKNQKKKELINKYMTILTDTEFTSIFKADEIYL